jgi:hypothetical protein
MGSGVVQLFLKPLLHIVVNRVNTFVIMHSLQKLVGQLFGQWEYGKFVRPI